MAGGTPSAFAKPDTPLQLTTGPAQLDATAAGRMLEAILRTLTACRCRYALRPVSGIPGTHELDPFRHGWRRGVYAFRIHPKCPHHGDARLAENLEIQERGYWREMDVEEAAYWTTLDQDERTGN